MRVRLEGALKEFKDVKVVIFKPGGGPADERANRSSDVPRMTAGRAALVGLMERYLRGLLDPFLTLLEVHKLMYFMQAVGEGLNLRFAKGPYGPYADNLRHLLHAIEGHLVSGYTDGGDRPDKQLDLVPGALENARAFLENNAETRARLERVFDLVEGFESPFGLELLSTVHWVARERTPQTLDDLVTHTYAWNERKRQFSRRQIKIAFEVLSEKSWIEHPAMPDSI